MKSIFYLLLVSLVVLTSCTNQTKNIAQNSKAEALTVAADSVTLSFAFTGCNRVGWEVKSSTNHSTANHVALDSILQDMQNLKRKPEFFFNLGDIVRAEQSDVNVLDSQLNAWTQLSTVNKFDKSGIKMIAVPGNHELLQSIKQSKEYPLPKSTAVWSNYMAKYMPKNPTIAPDKHGELNQLSFSFSQGNVGFVVLNTDTFNPAPTGQNFGFEGVTPIKWATEQLQSFKKDPAVDHIFVLGHRSYFVYGQPEFGHSGLPNGGTLWMAMQDAGAVALLTAHTHDYNRYQPGGTGPTQIIAGNAGSPGSSTFFGYSRIDIFASGKVALESRGYCVPSDYTAPNPGSSMQLRDSALLQWNGNTNALSYPYIVGCSD